jgi:UbiA prenyltransferase family
MLGMKHATSVAKPIPSYRHTVSCPIVLQDHPDPVGARTALPLVVDLDETLLRVDTLFTRPVQTLLSLFALKNGIAAFKRRLSGIAQLDVGSLPVREELLAYLKQEAAAGREIHLATAAEQAVAAGVAERFSIFRSVQGTDHDVNLKGPRKAERLKELFPGGFVYAGDSRADLPVWQSASAAIIVSANPKLSAAVQSAGVPIECAFNKTHQWAKNAIVLIPVILGWRYVTLASLATTLAMLLLLCVVASLTYLVNDMADLSTDRKHWSKRRRPFASGAIPVRDGLLVVGIALPVACLLGLWISPLAGICLISYVVVTLGCWFGRKHIPKLDSFIVPLQFIILILIGVFAARLAPYW